MRARRIGRGFAISKRSFVREWHLYNTSVDRMAQSVAAELMQENYLAWDSKKSKENPAEIRNKVARPADPQCNKSADASLLPFSH
jgi:transposase InsO family protein